ncbi:hypothetical protein ACP3TJ_11735 [Desulforudis sp. 1088]|uniref:hypothetical protein n=1 Tax=unclassified Candidatus Desulforudis TaxID=2635950 RepID=UPI003BC830A3
MQDKTDQSLAGTASRGTGRQTRCLCNKLICVVNGDDIEIKCNKCKRLVTIRTKGIVAVEFK